MPIPLPQFKQPLGLDELPDSPPSSDPDSPPEEAGTTSSPPAPRPPTLPEDDRPVPPPPKPQLPVPARRTRTSSAGDVQHAGQLVRGLLAILSGAAAALLARRGLTLRQPTKLELAEIGDPLGAILARHLPTEVISEDLLDAATAAAGAHAYATDGPLIERIPRADAEETP